MPSPSQGTSPDDLFGLSGQVAIVTGGGSGIGLATARALAGAGARVAILDRTPPHSAAAEFLDSHPSCFFLQGEVADEASVEGAFEAVLSREAKVDIVVNNAGLAIRQAAVDHTRSSFDEVMGVNVVGAFLCARTAARAMIARGEGGSIVNLASIMGLSGGGLYPNVSYQTSKGAIVNMTRALAVEWAPHRIRVNAVAPTYVRTPFIAPLLAQPELVRRIEDMTPLHRLAEPEEVAAAILFLAGPGAAMVTGHTLAVEGGFLAQ
jgi:NAD(P)-dependent dehydrogenase (short-subunit alcohol dehydrogenase family)